jgi:bifunctional aspartokinase / homoserine dehydrogenase 1
MTPPTNYHPVRTGLQSRHFLQHQSAPAPANGEARRSPRKPIRVMKFGGTSVGDPSAIKKVVEIICSAAQESHVVVVVSAMSGVTNQLVAASNHAEAGDYQPVAATFAELRRQHDAAADALIHSAAERSCLRRKVEELVQEGDRLCQGTMLLGELTPRTRDAISSLGERLSAPLVAAALAERGVATQAIEATKLVVTDSCHGGADPLMDLTRERCQSGLRPLLDQGIVPVVTGFIGATADGVLTTLGRGGSDYSATILGAALNADEVIIWTDVDGLQTADPRLVSGGRTIPEISYREAAELAYFGAKVLHPKTLRAVMQCGIPLWIRNTFASELPGTKITPSGPPSAAGVKALTAISDVAMITVGGPGLAGVQDVLGRTCRTAAAVRADVLLISQASSQNDLCLVISSALGKSMVEALRHEFAHDLMHEPTHEPAHEPAREPMQHIALDLGVAMVTVVGQNMRSVPGVVGRTFGALGRENVDIVAIAQGASDCTISFVVAKNDVKAALAGIHQEFHLGSPRRAQAAETLAENTLDQAENYYPPCAAVEAVPQPER